MPRTLPLEVARPVLTFRSTNPAPVVLSPGRTSRFTIQGTGLVFVKTVALFMKRTPWLLHGKIVSRDGTAITVTVDVPKYLAEGPYAIQVVTTGGSVTDTGLAAEAAERKPCEVWTEFSPRSHGYSFANSRWDDVCFTTVGLRFEYKASGPFCGSDWGLCGGMSLSAGERFRAGSTDTHDLSQADAKHAVADAQFRTLDAGTVANFLTWMYSPDESSPTDIHSVGYRMARDWENKIKPELDQYRPVVLGLIFDKFSGPDRLDPRNAMKVTKQHQVLGIGYSALSASTFQIYAYDPNVPDDILVLKFTKEQAGVDQGLDSGNVLPADRRPARGVMFVRGVP